MKKMHMLRKKIIVIAMNNGFGHPERQRSNLDW
jgi:hypothetical protein